MTAQEERKRMEELCALRRPLTGAEKWEMLDLKAREMQRIRWRRWYHNQPDKSDRLARVRAWRARQRAS